MFFDPSLNGDRHDVAAHARASRVGRAPRVAGATSNLALWACLAVVTAEAWGQQATASPPLPAVVITATRFEDDPRRVLADVTVISRDEIERAGAASAAQLLQSHGIETSETGGRGSLTGVFLRGTKTSQSVVLVDGIRLQNPTSGAPNLDFLPIESIERIEVLRGLSSPLYGSGAIGGVIHVVTRRPSGAPALRAGLGIGTQGTMQASLGYGGELGSGDRSTRFNLGLSRDKTSGYESTPTWSPDHQADRDGNRQSAATLSLAQRLGPHWQAGIDHFDTRGSNRYDDAFSTPATAVVDYRSGATSAWLSGRIVPTLWTQVRAGRSRIDYTFRAFAFAPRTETDTASWLNALDTRWGRFSAGIEREVQRISGEGLTTGAFAYQRDRRTIDSVLAGWDGEWGDQQLKLQVRRDRIETVGDATSGSAAWGMRIDGGWRVRASVASAFRAPTFDDLYNPFGSNPGLAPERARGGELGLEHEDRRGRIAATLFAHRIRDAIELDAGFVPTNLNRTQVRGLGLEARRAYGSLGVRGTLTLQQATGERTDATTGSVTTGPLSRRARQSGVVGADWRIDAWTLWSELRFQSDRVDTRGDPMAGYGVVSVGATRALSGDLSVLVRLSNLGDRRYQTAWGYDAAPRALFVAVRYQPR